MTEGVGKNDAFHAKRRSTARYFFDCRITGFELCGQFVQAGCNAGLPRPNAELTNAN
jgi:hypothetical protein